MEKRTITKWWIGGAVAMIPGTILIIASAMALAAHLEIVTHGNWDNLMPDDYSRTMVTLIALGGIFGSAGILAQIVAWMGAGLNARRLADAKWFNVLLSVGSLGIVTTPLFGLGALISGNLMIAYLVGAPDAIAPQPPRMLEKRMIQKWLNWGIVTMVAGTLFSLLVPRIGYPGGLLYGLIWLSLALVSLGFSIIVLGVIAATAAWWAAIFNTHHLEDKSWFNFLLWSGIVGTVTGPLFGIGALIALGVLVAYLRAGPDGMATRQRQTAPATRLPVTN